MKPKHLTLRPGEVARFLRPSGLVVIPCKKQPEHVGDGIYRILVGRGRWVTNELIERKFVAGKMISEMNVVDPLEEMMKRHCPCPLGGPGSQWVGREPWATWNDGIDGGDGSGKLLLYRADKSAYHMHTDTVCEQHGIKAGDEILRADFNPLEHEGDEYAVKWKSAATMPLHFARIRKTTTRVELRRVRTITKAEAIEYGMPHCDTCEHRSGQWGRGAIDDPLSSAAGGKPWHECDGICGGLSFAEWFKADFHARYPGSWDRDDYAWFVNWKTTTE